MFTLVKYTGTTALALGAMLIVSDVAQAQIVIAPGTRRIYPINANPQIAPGVNLLQYAYNTAVLGRAYSQVPPYLLGYNPYPPASVSVGGGGYAMPSYGGGGYGGSPYGGAPYGGGYSAGGIDPLTGMPTGGGYSSGGSPYPYNPYGGGYSSTASDISALGQLGINQEQARILREVANQAKLDTQKKKIDTLAYIRAHEYTFTQEQADIAKRLLERVQKTPTASEIQSGKSLNIMLEDLVKFSNQQFRGPTVTLDDDVLKLANIAGAGSNGNVGLLRDNGRFVWPVAFDNKDVAPEKERKDIELEAIQLYKQAANGQLDGNLVRNVESALQALRTNLGKQVTKIPSQNYLAGVRFLDDFDAALIGLKKGDVVLNLDFQAFVAKGGRTVQELVDYMGKRGLRFAPVSSGDDRAYVALQAALAAQSVAINAQVASSGKGY